MLNVLRYCFFYSPQSIHRSGMRGSSDAGVEPQSRRIGGVLRTTPCSLRTWTAHRKDTAFKGIKSESSKCAKITRSTSVTHNWQAERTCLCLRKQKVGQRPAQCVCVCVCVCDRFTFTGAWLGTTADGLYIVEAPLDLLGKRTEALRATYVRKGTSCLIPATS